MTFATFAKEQIQDTNSKNNKELEKQLRLKQQQDNATIIFYQTLSNLIKQSILQIQEKIIPLKVNKKGHIFLCNNEEINNHYNYDHRNIEPIDFFEHFGKLIPKNMFVELQSFLYEQGIKKLLLSYQYDGGGIKSWNEVYAVI